MPDPGGLRPDVETFACGGCQVTLVDAADILAAATTQRVDLFQEPVFPGPVRRARISIETVERDCVLNAEIRTDAHDAAKTRGDLPVLGNDPIGLLLARRVEAGDQWATRVVGGLGTAVAEASRLLGLGRPGADLVADESTARRSVTRDDEHTGLRATVKYHDVPSPGAQLVTIRAAVPHETISAAHLSAMFGFVLEVVGELGRDVGGVETLAGNRYILSRHPVGDSSGQDGTEIVSLDQVGGLGGVVAQFQQIAMSFRHPQVMARWGARRPQGILLYGPPGTGKTMLARALAHEIGATFREIRTPEIVDKFLGGSERNIKRIFAQARRYREPTVMLFDEFDSIISYASDGGDAASQAVNAVAGIFKQEMQNLIEDNPNVIVVATTNFPQRVDDSLIRSGRFDIKLAIPLPDAAGRAEIITKMIRQRMATHEVPGFRMFGDDLDVHQLASASHGMTGADIKEVLRRVQLAKAMREARTGTPAAPISQQDLKQTIAELRQAGTTS
jgi:transitional endoplasmic reticulum ATPase